MQEGFNPPPKTPEKSSSKEGLEKLKILFIEAEAKFDSEGREGAKPLLQGLYNTLIELNKRDKLDPLTIWIWNPEGNLTKEEFDVLNLRRMALSNAVGILTAAGVRHDVNPGVEPYRG